MNPDNLLLTAEDIRQALPQSIHVELVRGARVQDIGEVLRAAAVSSAYERYSAAVAVGGEERPITVSDLALIFGSEATARTVFNRVAEAAHLRTEIEGTMVAVETVTSGSGLVSFWGYITAGRVIVIVTLDTLDPHEIAMSEFRQIVVRAVEYVTSGLGGSLS